MRRTTLGHRRRRRYRGRIEQNAARDELAHARRLKIRRCCNENANDDGKVSLEYRVESHGAKRLVARVVPADTSRVLRPYSSMKKPGSTRWRNTKVQGGGHCQIDNRIF